MAVHIQLNTTELPLDNRRTVLSLFKHGLELYGGPYMIAQYYDRPRPKPYAWGLYLPGAKFLGSIQIKDPFMRLIFSTDDLKVFCDFYNALNMLRGREVKISGIGMMVSNITMMEENVVLSGDTWIKMLSPLVVREHDREANRDKYYTVDDLGFEHQLIRSVKTQLYALGKNPAWIQTLHVLDTSQAKRAMVTHYDRYVPATVGRLRISGSMELIKLLQKIGMGAQRSAGFGLFDAERPGGSYFNPTDIR